MKRPRRVRTKKDIGPTLFDSWSPERWTREVDEGAHQLPEPAREAISLIYREGYSYEDAAVKIEGHPVELLARICIGIRLLQEQLQRRHATIEPPWPRRGRGVPGAPIPTHRAIMTALETLRQN